LFYIDLITECFPLGQTQLKLFVCIWSNCIETQKYKRICVSWTSEPSFRRFTILIADIRHVADRLADALLWLLKLEYCRCAVRARQRLIFYCK